VRPASLISHRGDDKAIDVRRNLVHGSGQQASLGRVVRDQRVNGCGVCAKG
jgi:hypothetical protein